VPLSPSKSTLYKLLEFAQKEISPGQLFLDALE